MIECKCCGKTFERLHASQKYCSPECCSIVNLDRSKKNWAKNFKPKEVERVCVYCGKTFINVGHKRKYCSQECSDVMKKTQTKEAQNNAKRKPRKKSTSLRDMAKEAREHGMTYGQYVAKIEMQKGVSS